ncbi:ankyrin repeat domain-containing protein 17 [Biomphalaria pfeifferi]|uniref:Ankyrin repeat domain-containing protein 17 n=1 Tax=Biomphalaria pfeifferi TaxID=112525 RepID=A0AAD8CA31_BIOPF|nr:ankyrin repeat domain-containing protein 17 [Biomphalaria pfeifferi]
MMAAYSGHLETAQLLTMYGADINACSTNGWTALMIAIENTCIETLPDSSRKTLMSALNKMTLNETQTHFKKRHYDIVSMLVKSGVRVNASNQDGWTALMISAKNGLFETVKLLLQNGADVKLSNKQGVTALGIASGNGDEKIVELFGQYIRVFYGKSQPENTVSLQAFKNVDFIPWDVILKSKARSEHSKMDSNTQEFDQDQQGR